MSDNQKWHASWIIATLTPVGIVWLAGREGLDMLAMTTTISVAWLLAVALLWVMTPNRQHRAWKITASVALTGLATWAVWWTVKFDRPILSPEIEGLITQNYNGNALSIDLETLLKNTGRQSGYADSWQLDLLIDGTLIQGRELFGERLPEQAANEPPISDQEFPRKACTRLAVFCVSWRLPRLCSDLLHLRFSANGQGESTTFRVGFKDETPVESD